MTIFLRNFEELIYDENLEAADRLVDSRISASEKRADTYAVDFYKSYRTKLTKIRGAKRTYYSTLFEKEKNFKKEFEKYLETINAYSLIRAQRMMELTMKYASEQNLEYTLEFLHKYNNLLDAYTLDYYSSYELDKLTKKTSAFHKAFDPLVECDTLETITEAGKLVDLCLKYSKLTKSKVKPEYFEQQDNAVVNAIADWNDRQDIRTELSSLTDQSVIARLDTVNREGIYQWKDMIVVISSLQFSSKSELVRRGEAILHADQILINYIRIQKKIRLRGKTVKKGKTFMLSFKDYDENNYFKFNPANSRWQYMICYTSIINNKVTGEMTKFLPPLQFQEELSQAEN